MDGMSDDPIAAALHAEAEAARAEIRAAGIACPSCGVNMADLPGDHKLVLDPGGIDWERAVKRPPSALCGSGKLVGLEGASFETWQAAANASLYDDFRAREAEAWRREVMGTLERSDFQGFRAALGETGS